MDMSAAGLLVLTEREGCELEAYRDSRGIWTIGVGHTGAAGTPFPGPGVTITAQQAEDTFHSDLRGPIAVVNACGAMEQYQFDALVSLIHDIGMGAFMKSTVRRMILAKNWNAAARAILMWNQPPEIRSRREGEYVQFLHGEYVARIGETT